MSASGFGLFAVFLHFKKGKLCDVLFYLLYSTLKEQRVQNDFSPFQYLVSIVLARCCTVSCNYNMKLIVQQISRDNTILKPLLCVYV